MVSTVRQIRRNAPSPLQLETMRDFAGGLNLKDDPFNLAENESFDLQDVDLDRRGGFGVRRGVKPFIEVKDTARVVTASGASRTANVVTATGLIPVNGDATGGLVVGQQYTVNFADNGYDGTFTITGAVNGASTATWAQVAADDAAAGPGTLIEPNTFPDSGYTFVDTSLVRHILVARAGHVRRFDGGTNQWVDVVRIFGDSGRTEFEEFRDLLYIMPTTGSVPYTWAGAGLATQLTTVVGNYNDDLAAPNAGNFPQCNTMAVHKEVMWAGGVIDTGPTTHLCRVRWSHPGQAQDWRTNDFIDLDPDDENGRIRGMVPFGDRLIVFKDKAIYAIHGDPPSGFSVQNLTKELGAPTRHAIVATEECIYFWDKDKGAWKYDGKSFEWIFEPLFRLIDDGILNNQFLFQAICEFHRERLWVSVPSATSSPYKGVFLSLIYQPNSGKKGCWTLHTETGFGWWVHHGSDGGDEHLVGGLNGQPGTNFLYEFDTEDWFQDRQAFLPPVLRLRDPSGAANPWAATTPDAAGHDITTDIEIDFDAFREDWQDTNAVFGESMASKWQDTATGRSWYVILMNGGLIDFNWSTTGANNLFLDTTIPLPFTTGRQGIRIAFDVNDGAGNKVLTISVRIPGTNDYVVHEQVVSAGTTSIFNSTSQMVVGSATEAAGTLGGFFADTFGWTGEVHSLTVKNGIGGSAVASPDFSAQPALTPQFSDAQANVWTPVNGAFIAGGTLQNSPIKAWYTTRWFDAKQPAMKKRWKRPEFVVRAGSDQVTIVQSLADYDPSRVHKQFEISTFADEVTGVWDDPATEWDEEQWAAEDLLGGEKSVVLRGSPLAGGRARALRMLNTTQGQDWRIHGLVMKWKPRRIRN